MKRRFTILTAALALLTFLAVPMGMRGQSDYSSDYTGNVTLSTTGGTSASNCKVKINNTEYAGIKAGTGSVAGAVKITVPSGSKYLHLHLAGWNGENVTLSVTPDSNLSPKSISLTSNSGISGNSPFTWNTNGSAPSSSDYYKVITFTNALTQEIQFSFSATSGKRFVVWGVTAEEEGSQLTPSDLALTNAPVALSFDLYNNTSAQTVSYTTSSTGAITITPETSEYFTYEHNTTAKTITVTPVAVTPSPQTVTISQVADDTYAAGSASFTVAISAPSIVISESQLSLPCGANESGSFSISFTNGFVPNVAISPTFYSDADCLNPLPTSGDAAWIVITETDQNSINYSVTANTSTAARTAYLKVNAASNYTGNVVSISNVFTVTQAAPDYATLPFEFNSGKNAIEETIGLTQSGLGSDYADANTKLKFDGTDDYVILKINERPGILTFYIKGNTFSGGTFKVQTSADGESYSDLETYTTFGNNVTYEEEFDNLNENVRYIKWIYTEKVSGNVGLGNIALTKYVAPQQYDLTVTLSENVSAIYVFDADDQNNPLITDGAAGTVQVFEGKTIMVSPDVASGYVLASLMVNNENVISELDESGAYTFTMPANAVSITATAVEAPVTDDYELFSGNLVEGDYIIYYGGYAMKNTVESSRLSYEEVEPSTNVITTDNASIVWHIAPSGEYWTIYSAEVDAYAASTGSKNQAQMLASGTDDKALWTVTGTETFEFENKARAAATSNPNNKWLRNNGTNGFACYATSTGGALSLYKKVEPTPAGSTITVNGYGDTDGGYVLLAWPESTSPTAINGMISDNLGAQATSATATYDLYSYDESEDKEWLNYRKNSFGLVPGKGYLYASKDGVTLTYEGEANPEFADVDNLPYTENNLVKSLYLAGNSKTTTETFYVYDNDNNYNQIAFNYLVMNEDGNGFTSHQATWFEAQPLQGFFVQAPKANTILSTADLSDADGVSLLNLQVVRNRGTVVDNAIVSFSNGPTMKKFQLFENSTKLYIPQDDEDYAIVRSEAQGELPVSFRASENGTYTLSMNVENVDMNYLHLIDNMTGMDIDLLQTPSYTFEANTNDYANRFKLVFAANGTDEADESSFAFFSNGNLIVNNEGNATLQVIDINGRILSSETISGSCSKAINATTGVYMLRLINGDNVKVQKVVVR